MRSDETWACVERPFPVTTVPRVQDDLRLPRAKPRSMAIAVAYRLMAAARAVFGERRMLRVALNAAWLTRQFAYQLSYAQIGPAFLNATHGISEELLRAWVPPGGSVLDVGCGYGRLCRLAAPVAGRVVGIDYDAHRIDLARRHTTAPNVEFRTSDATSGLGTERFDVAILAHALEHIDDVGQLLRELQAVASTLIIEVPDFDGDVLNSVRRDVGCRWYSDNDHVREYTLRTLRDEVERHGWFVRHAERRGGMIVVIATQTSGAPSTKEVA